MGLVVWGFWIIALVFLDKCLLLVIRAQPDVVAVAQAGAELPVSVDRCSKAPAQNITPEDS